MSTSRTYGATHDPRPDDVYVIYAGNKESAEACSVGEGRRERYERGAA